MLYNYSTRAWAIEIRGRRTWRLTLLDEILIKYGTTAVALLFAKRRGLFPQSEYHAADASPESQYPEVNFSTRANAMPKGIINAASGSGIPNRVGSKTLFALVNNRGRNGEVIHRRPQLE